MEFGWAMRLEASVDRYAVGLEVRQDAEKEKLRGRSRHYEHDTKSKRTTRGEVGWGGGGLIQLSKKTFALNTRALWSLPWEHMFGVFGAAGQQVIWSGSRIRTRIDCNVKGKVRR